MSRAEDNLEYRLFKLYERAYREASFIDCKGVTNAPHSFTHWLTHEEKNAFALTVVAAVGRVLVRPDDMAGAPEEER